MKYRIPAQDPAAEFFYVCSLWPVHGLAACTLGVYQNDIEHIVLDEIRDDVPAQSHPKVDAGSSLQVPSEMVFRYVFGRDRDAVYDIARTVRWVLTAQQSAPATGSLPVRTEDQVCGIDLAGGEAEGGFAKIDLFDFAS